MGPRGSAGRYVINWSVSVVIEGMIGSLYGQLSGKHYVVYGSDFVNFLTKRIGSSSEELVTNPRSYLVSIMFTAVTGHTL